MTMVQARRERPGLVIGLVLVGIASRLLPHAPNVTPVTAIALFGGTHLPTRWSIALPVVIMAASDLIIGWHRTIPFTWGAFALTGALGWWVRRRLRMWRIALAATLGSTLFFVITNFGVWWVGGLYPKTAEGLWLCYIAALPFFRDMLLGDLGYTAACFGMYALATSSAFGRSAEPVS